MRTTATSIVSNIAVAGLTSLAFGQGPAPGPPAPVGSALPAPAAGPPAPHAAGKADCNNERLASTVELLDALSKAGPDALGDLYAKAKNIWNANYSQCKEQLKKDARQPDPFTIVFHILLETPQVLSKRLADLEFATDEAAIAKVRDEARKRVQLADAAYFALATVEKWHSEACLDLNDGDVARLDKILKDATQAEEWDKANKAASELACNALSRAHDRWRSIAAQAELRIKATKSLCGGFNAGGEFVKTCISYGITAATLSQVWMLTKEPFGMSGGRLLSVAVPFIGLRWTPSKSIYFLAVDFTAYSAYFGSVVVATPKPTPCFSHPNALESALNCEANPEIKPYAALSAALTVGSRNLAYVSFAPINIGFASVGQHGTHFFYGLTVSSVTLTGSF